MRAGWYQGLQEYRETMNVSRGNEIDVVGCGMTEAAEPLDFEELGIISVVGCYGAFCATRQTGRGSNQATGLKGISNG